MDPNNLAVNSVISSHPTSSFAEDERLRAAFPLILDEVFRDSTSELHHEMRSQILANLDGISFWYRLGARDERLGRV